MPPIPSYLVNLILVFVVLPFFTAVFLRFVLYCHLAYLYKRVKKLIREEKSSEDLAENLESEPEMIKRLLTRFKKASGVLEQVNTPALIDQIYSQERVGCLFCEQIDYFCRILPNLLLAFGLFCTFLGITSNLTALSQTLSQTNATSDISALVHKLQEPLQGMGIAFIGSLVGLISSAVLTLFNLKFNTTFVKFQLTSSLEDYLDNIYQPTIEGHSRLDKAVEKMVSTFDGFLYRFGQTVRDAVEFSLKENIQDIRNANIKASDLATEVYSRFLNASGTLERGAVIFREFAEVIERTEFPTQLSTLTEGLASAQRNLSQSSLLLNDSMKFTESATKLLHSSVVEIAHLNEKTTQVLELTQGSQQSLKEIIPQLHQGAQMFQPAVQTLDKLQERMETREDGFVDIQVELTKLVENVKNHTEQVSLEMKALHNQPVKHNTERIRDKNYIQLFNEETSDIQYQLASNAYVKGEHQEAAMIINALIKKFPKISKFHLLQGNIYYKLGDYELARVAYQLVLDTSTDSQLKDLAKTGLNSIKRSTKTF